MTSSLDIRVVKHNDITIQYTVKDKSGNIVDLTGSHIKWQVKKTYKTDALITKQSDAGGIVITDAVNGVFSIILDAIDTLNIAPGDYKHEAIVTNSAGKSVTLTDLGLSVGDFQLREQYTDQD